MWNLLLFTKEISFIWNLYIGNTNIKPTNLEIILKSSIRILNSFEET